MDKATTDKNVFIFEEFKSDSNLELRDYTHIRAYHACRPVNIDDCRKNGIRAYDAKELQVKAAKLFNVDIARIIEIDKSRNGSRVKRKEIDLHCFKDFLIEHCSHYLRYGSEYLKSLACGLDNKKTTKYHDILANTGTPTLLVCGIPIEMLSDNTIEDININYQYLFEITDCTISITQDIPWEYVINYEYYEPGIGLAY